MTHIIAVAIVMINHISYGLNLPNIDEFLVKNRSFSYVVVCRAVLVLESSQDSISTLTYFSQNSEKTGNFFVNKCIK